MKWLFSFITLFCLALATKAQESGRAQLPPVRSADNIHPPASTPVSLPLRSADNVKPSAQKLQPLPIRNGDNAAAAKNTSATEATVPVLKAAQAGAPQPTPVDLKALQGNIVATDSLPPSFLSPKQAMERLQKQATIKKLAP